MREGELPAAGVRASLSSVGIWLKGPAVNLRADAASGAPYPRLSAEPTLNALLDAEAKRSATSAVRRVGYWVGPFGQRVRYENLFLKRLGF
jgi:hypothetical protein